MRLHWRRGWSPEIWEKFCSGDMPYEQWYALHDDFTAALDAAWQPSTPSAPSDAPPFEAVRGVFDQRDCSVSIEDLHRAKNAIYPMAKVEFEKDMKELLGQPTAERPDLPPIYKRLKPEGPR